MTDLTLTLPNFGTDYVTLCMTFDNLTFTTRETDSQRQIRHLSKQSL